MVTFDINRLFELEEKVRCQRKNKIIKGIVTFGLMIGSVFTIVDYPLATVGLNFVSNIIWLWEI